MVVLTGARWTAISGDGLRRTRSGRGGPQACEPDGGGPSGGERRPEAVVGGGTRGKQCGGDRGLGRARQKGENGEGDMGLLFMGEEGADEVGRWLDFSPTWGMERETRARGREKAGREGGDVGAGAGAEWGARVAAKVAAWAH
uniref:Uncharacterized protein n=1 Tax=Oryza sativa subsp. japonica TaxID=39947 RepID=Q6YS16_ORYSJ|nr:hypothetical protein [Oryza sativa Japonica Group]